MVFQLEMWSKTLPAQSQQFIADSGQEAFSFVVLLDLPQLISGVHCHPLIPERRIVIRLFAAHPAGAVDLALCKTSWRSPRPCVDVRFTADSAKNTFLATNGAPALLAIVTAVSVQLRSLLDSSGRLQETSRNYALLQATYLPRRKTVITHHFNPFCFGYCTSVGIVKQVFSVRRAHQFFTHLNKDKKPRIVCPKLPCRHSLAANF